MSPAVRLRPPTRWGLLLLVLVAEILGLTWQFDFGVLAQADTAWARALWYAPRTLQWLLVCGATLAFLMAFGVWGRARLPPSRLQRLGGSLALPSHVWPPLLAHALTLSAFAAVTAWIVARAEEGEPLATPWLLAWLLLGLTTAASWAACLVVPSQWPGLLRRNWHVGLAALLVGTVAWGLGRLLIDQWESLGERTLWTSAALLQLVSQDVYCNPNDFLLGTPNFIVEISPSCSGYEGMGLMAVFVAAYLWMFRGQLRFPHALLLLPLGVAFAWLANAVRIAALIAVGTWLSPAIAQGGFHSQAGWLAFLGLSLGLVAVSQTSGVFARPTAAPANSETSPTAAYLLPLLILLATQMITGALSAGVDWLYPLRVVTTGLALWYFRRCYADLRFRVSPEAIAWGVLTFVVWFALEPWSATPVGAPEPLTAQSLAARWFWLTFRVVGSVLTVPVAEELAFRGYLLRRLQAANFETVSPGRFTLLSFLISSLLFGALHGRWIAGTLAGMIFAIALYRRRELGDAVLAHAVANALIAVAVLAGGLWQLWI